MIIVYRAEARFGHGSRHWRFKLCGISPGPQQKPVENVLTPLVAIAEASASARMDADRTEVAGPYAGLPADQVGCSAVRVTLT